MDFKLFGVIDVRFADLLDVGIVSVVLYYFFLLFKGTRAVQMFFGFGILVLLYVLAMFWNLRAVSWLFSNLVTVGLVSLVILFQPELRGALTRIGQTASNTTLRRIFFHNERMDPVITAIVEAVQKLSYKRIGALIVIERKVGLKTYQDTGEDLDCRVSARMLRSLFFPNSPLHDGAVIIHQDRIVAAGCTLPVLTAGEIDESLGMRHRAAKSIAGECDALVIVVSEETGAISTAYRNRLNRGLSVDDLGDQMRLLLLDTDKG